MKSGTRAAALLALLVAALAVAAAAGTQAAAATVEDDAPGKSENAPGQEKKDDAGAASDQGAGNEPPGCNGTIHLSSSATEQQGTDPKYTRGETVYAHGSGFDASESFTHWTIEDVNDHVMVKSDGGAISSDSGG